MRPTQAIIALIFAVALAAPAQARNLVDFLEADLPPGAVPFEWVEVTVNRQVITSGEIDELLRSAMQQQGISELNQITYRELRSQVTQEAVADLLLVEEAKRLDLSVRPDVLDAYVDAELRRHRRMYSSAEDFERYLRLQGSTIATWKAEARERIERELLMQQLLNRIVLRGDQGVSDEELEAYLNANPNARQELERVLLRHILLELDPDAPSERVRERYEDIRIVAARLKSGEAFAKVARDVSEDEETREQGGRIGFIQHGEWPEAEIAFEKEPGDLIGPIRDDEGLHIVEVLAVQTLRDRLFYRKRQYALHNYLADLREAADIDTKPKPFSMYRSQVQ